jgi:hypothetical protein
MENVKEVFKHGYILATGFCIALICEKIGAFNAVAGLLAMFIMAE